MLFSIKCSDTAFNHPNVPSPVAQLITNSLQLVQPLEVHRDTLRKLTLPPFDTQTMLSTNGLKFNFSPVMHIAPLHCLQHRLIHIIREHELRGRVRRGRGDGWWVTKVTRGATGDFTRLLQILVVTIFVLTLQPNPIHIANIGVTFCPLRDNPQILNVQMNLCLSILFERNLQILESSKPKQTTIFHLNRMPVLPLPRAERGLPELIKTSNGPQSSGASPLLLTHSVSHMHPWSLELSSLWNKPQQKHRKKRPP